MYKEIKENLINISSSILSVQNKMVNVYYKGNNKNKKASKKYIVL